MSHRLSINTNKQTYKQTYKQTNRYTYYLNHTTVIKMARPSKFSDEEILAAAAKLADAGKQITGYALSVELEGGRPSSLEERYQELTASKEPVQELPALPADVAAAVHTLAGQVAESLTVTLTNAHATLKKQANERVDEIEKAAREQVSKSKNELDDAVERLGAALESAEQASTALGAANETIQALRIDLSKQEGAAEEAARQLAQVKADLGVRSSELQASLNEAAKLNAQLAQAHAERDAARESAGVEAEARNAARLDAAAAKAKLEQVSERVESLQSQHASLQKQAGSLESQLHSVAGERDALKERLAEETQAKVAGERRLAETQSQLSELQGAHKQLQAELFELKKQLKEYKSR